MRNTPLALILAASLVVACGGKVKEQAEFDDGGADTGAPTETGGDADPGDAPAPDDAISKPDSPPPSAETCKRFVSTMCSGKAEACCGTAGHMWNESACKTNIDYYCNALVDQVSLGRATYDESYLDACMKGWESNLTACEVDGLTSAKNQIACTQLFNGTKKPGDTCTGKSFLECHAPTGFGAYCDLRPGESEGKCRAYGFVGLDQPCNYYGSTVRYCDMGLYCDITSPMATCKPAKMVGAPCDGPDDFSCGLQHVCRDKKCAPLAPEGAMCSANEQCASYQCTGGKCAKGENAVVSPWLCNGGM